MGFVSLKYLAGLGIAATACGGFADAQDNIVGIVDSTASLSTLDSLLDGDFSAVATTLAVTPATYTLFAPKDSAFEAAIAAFPKLENSAENKFVDTDKYEMVMTKILEYHLLTSQELTSSQVSTDSTSTDEVLYATALQDENLTPETILDAVDLENVDIDASNGIVHLCDSVLVPSFLSNSIVDEIAPFGEAKENQDDPILNTVVSLLSARTEVLQTVVETDEITVFGPTDAAFEKLGMVVDYLGYTHNSDLLDYVLASHVAKSYVTSTDYSGLGQDDEVEMVSGEMVKVSQIIVDTNYVDITSNGYVDQIAHVVTDVIVPSNLPAYASLAELAGDVDSLSSLVAALTKGSLAAAVGVVDADTSFTVFAPNNDAFATFLDGAELDDIETEALVTVLSRHVIAGEVILSGAVETKEYTTLAGEKVSVVVSDDGVTVNGVSVIAPDNRAWNGVAHIVDGVIPELEDDDEEEDETDGAVSVNAVSLTIVVSVFVSMISAVYAF